MSERKVFAITENGNAVDEMIDGVGNFSGKTLQALQATHGKLTLMTGLEALRLRDAKSVTLPTRIDQDEFNIHLTVHPPKRRTAYDGWEVFYVPYTAVFHVHTVVVRNSEGDCFRMERDVQKEDRTDWIKLCENFLAVEGE